MGSKLTEIYLTYLLRFALAAYHVIVGLFHGMHQKPSVTGICKEARAIFSLAFLLLPTAAFYCTY